MHNCLAGCVNEYAQGQLYGDNYGRGKIDVENYSPFIWIKLYSKEGAAGGGETNQEGAASIITVGNKSYGEFNTAVIKSIDFGFIDTLEGTVEILDEQGSAFGVFVDSLQKCNSTIGIGSIMDYKVGWVYTGCKPGVSGKVESPTMKAMVGKIEVNYGQIMKYRVSFTLISPLTYDHRHPITLGEEEVGKDMHLEDAIEKLCELPPAIKVKFAWYDQSGNLQFGHHKWTEGGEKGPKNSWKGDRQNKYFAIARWISQYKIDDGKKGKSALLVHNPSVHDELWVLRDPDASPGETISSGLLHIGTFIVNGGKCSNVIEFSPKFDFMSAHSLQSSGGGTSGGLKTTNVSLQDEKEKETEGRTCCNSEDTGIQQQATVTDQAIRTYGKDAPEKVNEARLLNIKANKLTTYNSPITADIRIIGDPSAIFFELPMGKRVSVVVVNPNFLQKATNGSCTDWLKKSDCNKYLSNKDWLVMGINHSVQEGSYVTTLKLQLMAPGVDNGPKEKLGANDSGGELKSEC
jgi:hypothetical protein